MSDANEDEHLKMMKALYEAHKDNSNTAEVVNVFRAAIDKHSFHAFHALHAFVSCDNCLNLPCAEQVLMHYASLDDESLQFPTAIVQYVPFYKDKPYAQSVYLASANLVPQYALMRMQALAQTDWAASVIPDFVAQYGQEALVERYLSMHADKPFYPALLTLFGRDQGATGSDFDPEP